MSLDDTMRVSYPTNDGRRDRRGMHTGQDRRPRSAYQSYRPKRTDLLFGLTLRVFHKLAPATITNSRRRGKSCSSSSRHRRDDRDSHGSPGSVCHPVTVGAPLAVSRTYDPRLSRPSVITSARSQPGHHSRAAESTSQTMLMTGHASAAVSRRE